MRPRLFIRWVLLNSTLIAASVLGVLAAPGRIHGALIVAIPLISALYGAGAILAGYLLFHADREKLSFKKDIILHRADLLVDVAEECQYAGMLCMIGGFYVILSAHFTGTSDLVAHVENGGPLALGGTFIGVLGSRLLSLQHRWLVRNV